MVENKHKINLLLLMLFILLPMKNAYAARGCCSHHGGIDYCGYNGYYICNDGTQSPSCVCSSYSLDYEHGSIKLTDGCDYDFYLEQIRELTNENEILKSKNQELEEKANYEEYFYFLLIGVIIYAFYRIYLANKN